MKHKLAPRGRRFNFRTYSRAHNRDAPNALIIIEALVHRQLAASALAIGYDKLAAHHFELAATMFTAGAPRAPATAAAEASATQCVRLWAALAAPRPLGRVHAFEEEILAEARAEIARHAPAVRS